MISTEMCNQISGEGGGGGGGRGDNASKKPELVCIQKPELVLGPGNPSTIVLFNGWVSIVSIDNLFSLSLFCILGLL